MREELKSEEAENYRVHRKRIRNS